MAGEKNSKYKPEYDELAYNYALLGAKDTQLAEFFSVAESTINLWKLEHPTFSESLKRGKAFADANVAKSLYHRALGYQHMETKIATHQGIVTDTVDVVKQHAPDTSAAIFWLKNRQPELWRDKKEITMEKGEVTPWDEIGDEDEDE